MENIKNINTNGADTIVFWGIILTFFLEYLNPSYYFSILKVLHFGTVVPLGLFGIWLLLGSRKQFSVPQTKLLIILAGVIFLSMLWALVTSRAYLAFRQFFGYLLFYLLIANSVFSMKQLKRIFFALVVIHLIIVFLNLDIFQHETRSGSFRAGYFLGDGNDFSLSLVVLTPIAGALAFAGKAKISKIFYLIAAVTFLGAIIILESRASTLAIGSMCVPMVLKSRNKLASLALIGIVFFAIVFFAAEHYINRMESISNYRQDTSAMGRIEAWKAGFKMVARNPLGVGAGNFNSYYGRFLIPPNAPYRNRWISPHNTYIQCLAELGIVGFIVFCLLFRKNFKVLNKIQRDTDSSVSEYTEYRLISFALLLSFTGFAVNAFFLGTLYYPHLFTLSGFIVIIATLSPSLNPQPNIDKQIKI